MKNRGTVGLRAIRLTVVEARQIVEALGSAKVLRRLGGRQRQFLEDAIEQFSRAMERPVDGNVDVPEHIAVMVMKCIAMAQAWFAEMLDTFADSDVE